MSEAAKFRPQPEGLVGEFYARVAETGGLHFQRCRDCGTWRHPPRYYCAACASPDWEFAPSGGAGTVQSAMLTERAFDPGWAGEVPYTLVVVELDEGPRVLTAARPGFPRADFPLGARVQVEVEPQGAGFAFFWTIPLSGTDGVAG